MPVKSFELAGLLRYTSRSQTSAGPAKARPQLWLAGTSLQVSFVFGLTMASVQMSSTGYEKHTSSGHKFKHKVKQMRAHLSIFRTVLVVCAAVICTIDSRFSEGPLCSHQQGVRQCVSVRLAGAGKGVVALSVCCAMGWHPTHGRQCTPDSGCVPHWSLTGTMQVSCGAGGQL